MKIHIWIKKEDVTTGTITEYHTHLPQVSYNNYVQVSISVDEFTRLEDVHKNTTTNQLEFGFQSDVDCNYTVSIDGPGIEYNNTI